MHILWVFGRLISCERIACCPFLSHCPSLSSRNARTASGAWLWWKYGATCIPVVWLEVIELCGSTINDDDVVGQLFLIVALAATDCFCRRWFTPPADDYDNNNDYPTMNEWTSMGSKEEGPLPVLQ